MIQLDPTRVHHYALSAIPGNCNRSGVLHFHGVSGCRCRATPPRSAAATYRAYRVMMHLILGLLAAFFLLGDRIAWNIGLVGLAWRAWLLMFTLPVWHAALRPPIQ